MCIFYKSHSIKCKLYSVQAMSFVFWIFLCLIDMLLEDSLQKRSLATLWVRISKGELLRMTKLNQWMVVYSYPPIFVDIHINQVKIVKPKFIQYLLAIENVIFRYNLFINKQDFLIKCMFLNVGDKVDVILEQHDIPSAAIVRYKGKLPRKRGIFFGVEMLVSKGVSYVYVATICLSELK